MFLNIQKYLLSLKKIATFAIVIPNTIFLPLRKLIPIEKNVLAVKRGRFAFLYLIDIVFSTIIKDSFALLLSCLAEGLILHNDRSILCVKSSLLLYISINTLTVEQDGSG